MVLPRIARMRYVNQFILLGYHGMRLLNGLNQATFKHGSIYYSTLQPPFSRDWCETRLPAVQSRLKKSDPLRLATCSRCSSPSQLLVTGSMEKRLSINMSCPLCEPGLTSSAFGHNRLLRGIYAPQRRYKIMECRRLPAKSLILTALLVAMAALCLVPMLATKTDRAGH